MLHFAYGSNMSRALMERRCPTARALGAALLSGWRYVITRDGYASVEPKAGGEVHGVLWRLAPRDLAALNAYESLDTGLYIRRMLAVTREDRRASALVYIGRNGAEGRPKPGYQDIVIAAAREWDLPETYIRTLERWAPPALSGSRPAETGELA
jgi:cation transport regulator ChaC